MSLSLRLAALQVIHQPRRWNNKERREKGAEQAVQPQQSNVETDEAKRNPEKSERTIRFDPQMSL